MDGHELPRGCQFLRPCWTEVRTNKYGHNPVTEKQQHRQKSSVYLLTMKPPSTISRRNFSKQSIGAAAAAFFGTGVLSKAQQMIDTSYYLVCDREPDSYPVPPDINLERDEWNGAMTRSADDPGSTLTTHLRHLGSTWFLAGPRVGDYTSNEFDLKAYSKTIFSSVEGGFLGPRSLDISQRVKIIDATPAFSTDDSSLFQGRHNDRLFEGVLQIVSGKVEFKVIWHEEESADFTITAGLENGGVSAGLEYSPPSGSTTLMNTMTTLWSFSVVHESVLQAKLALLQRPTRYGYGSRTVGLDGGANFPWFTPLGDFTP
jgi:hypothetical protein